MKITSRVTNFLPEILGSVICLSLGMLSGFVAHAGDSIWYMQLHKPFFNPPSWVFAPVWIILYCMIGIVAGMLWREKSHHKTLILLFGFQFLCNLAWSPIFFYAHRMHLACLDLFVLWLTLLVFMIVARKQKRIFLLCVSYVAWVSFALVLNLSIVCMN